MPLFGKKGIKIGKVKIDKPKIVISKPKVKIKVSVPQIKIDPVSTAREVLKQGKKIKDKIDHESTKAKANIDRELTTSKENVTQIATDIKEDIDRELTIVYKNIKRETDQGINKAGMALEATGQPDNLARMAMIYTASAYGGPLGSAMANAILDKYIFKKNMSDEDLFKSFVVGAAAGYAGEFADSGTTSSSFIDSLPEASSRLAQSLAEDAGTVLIDGRPYSFEDFASSVLTSAVEINIGDGMTQDVFDSAINSAADYTVAAATRAENIDMDALSDHIYTGMANGVSRELVNDVMDKHVMPHLPKEQRLDKELFEVVNSALTEIFTVTQYLEQPNVELGVKYTDVPLGVTEEDLWDGVQERAIASTDLSGDNFEMSLAEQMNFIEKGIEYLETELVNIDNIYIDRHTDQEIVGYSVKEHINDLNKKWNGQLLSDSDLLLHKIKKKVLHKGITYVAKKVAEYVFLGPGKVAVDVISGVVETGSNLNGEGEVYGRARLNRLREKVNKINNEIMQKRIMKYDLLKPELPKLKINDWIDRCEQGSESHEEQTPEPSGDPLA